MCKLINLILVIGLLVVGFPVNANNDINMTDVRSLAKLTVDEILNNSVVNILEIESYWTIVHKRNRPLVVFFYSNNHGPSQRLATLIKYVAPIYTSQLTFLRVKVSDKGKPAKDKANILTTSYSLDDTPGILFYDNVGTSMVLEDEDYIDADFKEFRTPRMILWKTYYNAVRKELDKLLAD